MAIPNPPRTASKTALGVALQRMIHQTLDDEPKILLDPIAELLLDESMRHQLTTRLQGARGGSRTA